MNGTVNYSVEGAKYGISFGTALAIATPTIILYCGRSSTAYSAGFM